MGSAGRRADSKLVTGRPWSKSCNRHVHWLPVEIVLEVWKVISQRSPLCLIEQVTGERSRELGMAEV